MTKVWTRSEAEYTQARNLDMKDNAAAYLGIACGDSMKGRFPNTRLDILSDDTPADYFVVGPLFVVSDRLMNVLNELKAHAEFFPVEVSQHGKAYTVQSFVFCNILDCIDCFDQVRGKCTFWKKAGFTDRMDTIQKLPDIAFFALRMVESILSA